jgi:hypothetical protein
VSAGEKPSMRSMRISLRSDRRLPVLIVKVQVDSHGEAILVYNRSRSGLDLALGGAAKARRSALSTGRSPVYRSSHCEAWRRGIPD